MSGNHQHPVIGKLRRAGRVHSRHRGLLAFLRLSKWPLVALPLLMLADVLFHFSGPPRLAASIALAAAFLALTAACAAIALFARPPLLRTARMLEAKHPALGSRLVNFLQLEDASRSSSASPLTRSLAARAVEQAADSVASADLPTLARTRGLRRHFLLAAIAPAVLLLLTLFGGHPVRLEWMRFLDPFGDHPPFSLTRLEITLPAANHEVVFGQSTVVEATAAGHRPRELFLTARPVSGTGPAFTLPMIPRGDGSFVVSLENIRQPLELTAHTADEASRSHRRRLGVILTPRIGPALLRLSPPAYTGQPPREIPFRFTGVQALEGSSISFLLHSNRPLGAGNLSLLDASGATRQFPLAPAPGDAPETATASLIAEASGRLVFSVIDVDGHSAEETPSTSLTVTRDQPPAISIADPEKDALVVENLTLPIVIDAADDYGLRSIRLHVGLNGAFPEPLVTAFDPPGVRQHRLTHPLDLAAIGAKAGDEITIFAEAIDIRPDPQITRTATRTLALITEAEYNEHLRKQADVAMIAGKYEALAERLRQHVEQQQRIEEKRRELAASLARDPADETALRELADTLAQQEELNAAIDQLAADMKNLGRENPVYDFEKDLHDSLRRQADRLEASTAMERERSAAATDMPPADRASALADAAKEQRERLEGDRRDLQSDVIEPLADASRLHELMKDFRQFEQLTAAQQELAAQSQAYQDKDELTADDRLALRAMGARQREQAAKIESLARKLRHDADAAREDFPEAAASADDLARRLENDGLPTLARSAAQSMLAADAAASHPKARQLHEAMDALFCDACQNGQQGVAGSLDRALRLTRGISPGDSLRQMMLSMNFRPPPGAGASGSGSAGFMADSSSAGSPKLIGGESLLSGPIAHALAGQGGPDGPGSGGPTAKLDQIDDSKPGRESSRRTATPSSGSIFLEYENIADAYFRRLTTPR